MISNAALSYTHGASNVPLIGETIGVHFDRPWRAGAIGRRWSCASRASLELPRAGEKVDAFAAGLLALGLSRASASASGRRTTPSGW